MFVWLVLIPINHNSFFGFPPILPFPPITDDPEARAHRRSTCAKVAWEDSQGHLDLLTRTFLNLCKSPTVLVCEPWLEVTTSIVHLYPSLAWLRNGSPTALIPWHSRMDPVFQHVFAIRYSPFRGGHRSCFLSFLTMT